MPTQYFQPVLLLTQIILLFFLSRSTINELFSCLRIFIKNEELVFSLVSLIVLPGTILHEMAHFFTAMILLLPVREIKIFPEWEKNYIKLGHVIYEKKDFVRGIIVGIAPVFIAILFFWWLSAFKIFPNTNVYINIIFLYILFSVSSTMFSSPQDLVDLIYIIPLVIIVSAIVYILNIRVSIENKKAVLVFIDLSKTINYYLFVSLIINIVFFGLFKSLKKIKK